MATPTKCEHDELSVTVYTAVMIIPWRRLALYAARKIAASPETRAEVAEVVQQAGQEARRIIDSPNPARTAGQTIRRAGDQLRRRLRSED
jgi:hypothetical protein